MGNLLSPAVEPAEAGCRCSGFPGLAASRSGSGPTRAVRRSIRGFTLIELLTVLAVLAVLGTLLSAFLANSRLRSQQSGCTDQLRQVARAIEVYTHDMGRRPRSLSKVMQSQPPKSKVDFFVCPADPALRRASEQGRATNLFWGNIANETQEPWEPGDFSSPESGSWTAELAEVNETEPFSYLHPLAWRRAAWQRLAALGSETGTAICQLHGVRLPSSVAIPNRKNYLQYEGEVLRAQRDGSVLPRKVFRPGATGDKPAGTDYPWEFYTDAQVNQTR